MSKKFLIKNDILTVQEFSDFLAFALKDQPQYQRLQLKMNLRIIGTYEFSKNPVKRLLQQFQIYVRRNKRMAKQFKPERETAINR